MAKNLVLGPNFFSQKSGRTLSDRRTDGQTDRPLNGRQTDRRASVMSHVQHDKM